ncbi:hypothetical protein I6M74_17295 [Acinetobacter bereziniae]|uniref:hypothetical protein n=2 Tax=Acinetobacter bereziniae TaxID=106648 RepID=UPI001900C9EA|nr:hypothetical protein [Acinetobacter bereziniae]MBJ8423639.1 hypothetical protein [Acinetobacter bereziniae]
MNTPHDIIGYKQPIVGNIDKGHVVPIAKVENGIISKIVSEDYPNSGTVFISRNYEEIDSKYNNDELFLIRANLSFDYEENKEIPHKSKFWSDSSNLKPLDTNILIPILVSSNLPEKETGIWQNINPNDVPNKPFFILMGNHVYGPFLPQSKNENVEIAPYNTTILGIPQNTISKIDWSHLEDNDLVLIADINNKKKIFLKSFLLISDITNKKENQLDYISNANLINFFTKNGFGKNLGNLSKAEATKLKGLIESFSKEKSFNNNIQNNERFIRIKSILDEFIDHNNENYNIINNFLKSKEGQVYLESYFNKNQLEMTKLLEEKIKKQHDDMYQQYTTVLNDKKSRLDKQYEVEKDLYSKQITELRLELESLKNESKNAAEAKIDENIQNKKLDLERINLEINQLLKDKLDAETLVEAKSYVKFLEKKTKEELKELEDQIETYNTTIETQKTLFKDNLNLSSAISQTKLIQSIFDESEKEEIILNECDDIVFIPKAIENIYYDITKEIDNRAEYIKLIQNNINSCKEKTLSYDETANLIITLIQNYITVFSGSPGVGKTSTANNLGKAFGLINPESRSKNFLNVSVGRGWTTTQDFLGYYNSLKNTFQPSKTGLYQFLKDENKIFNDFLKIVLLDEANLSSIEHYWSDFLSICDNFENKSIDLGIPDKDSRFLELPSSLRFIATINNDSTVEPLSERLLDRAAIITLNNDHINDDFISNNLVDGAVPYNLLKESFTINIQDNDIDNSDFSFSIVSNIINELKTDNIKGGQIQVSSRKINTIKNYIKIANDVGFENHLSPADYAISQHILPKIKGHGPSLKLRLENILKILKDNDLKNSQKILTNILNNGNSFTDSFDFFN